MKWTYLYGEKKYPYKTFTDDDFAKLINLVSELDSGHVTSFMKHGNVRKAFNILYSQQFYLQKRVHKEIFATQLKLYSTLKSKYDIEASFREKTRLSIYEFLSLLHLTWVFTNANRVDTKMKYGGHLSRDFLNVCSELVSPLAVQNFLTLLTIDTRNAEEKIETFKRGITKKELQSLEITFFTIFPFQVHKDQIKLIHPAVFNYTANYFIHDFLKANDIYFGGEFGRRFEKYIALGLNEINLKFKPETELKKLLPANSNVVDFLLEEDNVVIECKAIELQAYTSINPTDELLFSSIKDSLIKAYSKQMLATTALLKNDKEKWGIVLTYKQLFWSRFSDIWEVVKQKEKQEIKELDTTLLPPENVFLIDIYAWDEIIQIVKEKKATLTELLEKAKENNSTPETSKQLFEMHLDVYKTKSFHLDYLEKELEQLNRKFVK
ncbi:MAG: hypothetical protein ABI851_16575 [Saprospiraceae bacterium]